MTHRETPLSPDSADDGAIARAAEALRQGKLVGMPTETVYGLAADAMNPQAVARIFQAKQRPAFDPLIVHIASQTMVQQVASQVPPLAQRLAEAFWPGPLTLVLPKQSTVADLVTSGLPTVAVRWPNHPVAQRLIEATDSPLAAPSANRFGGISPTRPEHVTAELGHCESLAMVLDGGPCEHGVESTVVRVVDEQAYILRLGSLTLERLETVAGRDQLVTELNPTNEQDKTVASPGMLSRHYAPRTPLHLCHNLQHAIDLATTVTQPAGLLAFAISNTATAQSLAQHFAVVQDLSPGGDLVEAAAGLFAAMRRLDASDCKTLLAVRLPDRDLGRAMNDRLQRAAN